MSGWIQVIIAGGSILISAIVNLGIMNYILRDMHIRLKALEVKEQRNSEKIAAFTGKVNGETYRPEEV